MHRMLQAHDPQPTHLIHPAFRAPPFTPLPPPHPTPLHK